MSQQTWTFDAPTGVYKSHAMSSKLRLASVEESVFMDFVRTEPGFGKGRGDTLTITRMANITEPTTAVLSETERISEDTFTLSTQSVTVQELGRAVPYTSLSTDLSEFNLENPIQRKLRQQMTLVLDTLAAAAFQTGQIKYAPTGLTSRNIATAGTFGATAAANLNVWHVEEIRDYMYDTLQVDMLGGNYVGIFRTQGLRGLKRDPTWEEWHKYTDPSAKYNNEIGRIEQVRFLETNHANALANNLGTGSVLGEGVVFGDDAVYMAEAVSPELRAGMPQDFGRSRAVAWYGVLAFDQIWDDSGNAGQARVVHVGSA